MSLGDGTSRITSKNIIIQEGLIKILFKIKIHACMHVCMYVKVISYNTPIYMGYGTKLNMEYLHCLHSRWLLEITSF